MENIVHVHTLNDFSQHIINNYDLSRNNTMALSCTAHKAVELKNETHIDDLFSYLSTENIDTEIVVLSGGSNVLLPEYLNKLVILPQYTGISVFEESDEHVHVEVMAGNNWHDFVVTCTTNSWFGLENLALIPGLVGASPVQNIGAYGVQLEDCFVSLKAYHIPSRTWHTFTKEECDFNYRDSKFKQEPSTWLISRVTFKLHKDNKKLCMNYGDVSAKAQELANARDDNNEISPLDVMNAIIAIRQSKLPNPAELANTGSFFQNPIIEREHYNKLLETYPNIPKYDIDELRVKVPAGWLIDNSGLKGKGVYPILTHTKQALVLTNHERFKASRDDICKARDLIINTIQNDYNIQLHVEPVWIQ